MLCLKHILIKGRGFQGGSDEIMRRMWLGREIVVAGLPPLDHDPPMIPWAGHNSKALKLKYFKL